MPERTPPSSKPSSRKPQQGRVSQNQSQVKRELPMTPWRRFLGFLNGLVFCSIAGGVLLVIALVIWAGRGLPSIEGTLEEGVDPNRGTQIYSTDGELIMSQGRYHHKQVKLEEVSPAFVDALLSTEDRRFYWHPGVDPIAIARAIVRDIVHRRIMEGGSTLTQQLARNVFLSNERSLKRKIREALLALILERKLSKKQILELYVNNTYFGEGAYGIYAASQVYFNKLPSQLTVDEASMLAGMPQAPSTYNPYYNPEAAKARRNEVLANLVECHKLDSGELEKLQAKRLRINPNGKDLASSNRAPYFNQMVINQLMQDYGLDEQSFWQSGLRVITTLDFKAQMAATRSVRNLSISAGRTGKKQQAALLSLDPHTGKILAYVGGKDFGFSQFDRVKEGKRSPGSLFKVFTYAAAVGNGYLPNRVYLDEPLQAGTWKPENYDKQHHGYMSLAQAFAKSNNIVAVKLIQELSPQSVIDIARRMGIRNGELPNDLTLTLGSAGVSLWEMTSSFGVLANQGVMVEPYAIESVKDREGRVLFEHETRSEEVLDRTTVDTMVAMMMGVVQYGTGKAANIGRPVAGKTGTSDDHRDAWFIGFTPEIVTGVWVGNDDNSPVPGLSGGGLPAQIWRASMQPMLSGKPPSQFDLTYSQPITPEDFTTYHIENLSSNEPKSAEQPALQQEQTVLNEEGIPLRDKQDPSQPQLDNSENQTEDVVEPSAKSGLKKTASVKNTIPELAAPPAPPRSPVAPRAIKPAPAPTPKPGAPKSAGIIPIPRREAPVLPAPSRRDIIPLPLSRPSN
ncbi:MAG: PBP1A family penicillin-binding protein [Cyanobacteria bacterium]|nr:PBP1A family penicillin-binding protein [Cyanobacteriota bacterium]